MVLALNFSTWICEELETEREYEGYLYFVTHGITLVILGSLCGLKSAYQIWLWMINDNAKEFLKYFKWKYLEAYEYNKKICIEFRKTTQDRSYLKVLSHIML